MAKRRGQGDGSIRKRKDGRWEARYTTEDGKRRSVFGLTRAKVASKMRRSLTRDEDGLPIPGELLTVKQHMGAWLKNVKLEVRPTTWSAYERLVRLHILPSLGRIRLVKLTPEHLRELFRSKLDAGLSLRTVQFVRVLLKLALADALKDGNVGRNVAALTKALKATENTKPARPMRTLTTKEAKTLLKAADGDPLEALYVLALTTGMRQGELLGLRWSAVNLPKGTLSVVGTLQRTPDGLRVMEPKTKASRRKIQLTAGAVAALRRRRTIQAEEHRKFDEVWTDTGLVFTNELGRGIEKQNLMRRSFWPLLHRAGLAVEVKVKARRRYGEEVKETEVTTYRPAITFHQLRHSSATLLLEQGTHPAVVAAMLGHSKTSTTLNIYSHVTPTIMGAAKDVMEEILS